MKIAALLLLTACSSAEAVTIRISDYSRGESWTFADCQPSTEPRASSAVSVQQAFTCTARFPACVPIDPQWRREDGGARIALSANNVGPWNRNIPAEVVFEDCSLIASSDELKRYDCSTGLPGEAVEPKGEACE